MDTLEAVKKVDIETIKKRRKRIEELQKQRLFPAEFDFPLLLQLELTRQCNVFCKHCYNNSGVNNEVKDKMTPEKWKEFCRYIVSNGGIFECVLSGGEPLLLGEHLFEIMDILGKDGTYFLLITNGYLLTEKIISRLENYRYKWIQVSIDGANPEFHDSFRQKQGSWERAVKGAYMISKAGLPLTIAHSVSPRNLYDIDKMCDLAYSLGAGNIILGEITLSGRTYENIDLLLDDEQKKYLLDRIVYNAKRFEGKMKVQRSMDEKIQQENYIGVPNGALIIRPDGNIRLDCMTPFTIGNILKDDFVEIWNTKGKHCWKHPAVLEYFASKTVRNYVDSDIIL